MLLHGQKITAVGVPVCLPWDNLRMSEARIHRRKAEYICTPAYAYGVLRTPSDKTNYSTNVGSDLQNLL